MSRKAGVLGILAASLQIGMAVLPDILLIPFSHDFATNVCKSRWALFAVAFHSLAFTVGFRKRRMFVKW